MHAADPDTTVSGSGSFAPLGSAIYTEAGTITLAMLPSGDFVPSVVSNSFTASFNGEPTRLRGQTLWRSVQPHLQTINDSRRHRHFQRRERLRNSYRHDDHVFWQSCPWLFWHCWSYGQIIRTVFVPSTYGCARKLREIRKHGPYARKQIILNVTLSSLLGNSRSHVAS